ncbi:MAG: 3-isopropylmalate dehydratase large subunit, partial [Candidatus Margulisbacteria bacterium]|nr:3-isopropylmalate dehydratase large subunit [Candidatus Margulisiibacteriota bacterium]
MSERTLYDKVWARHKVATLETGQDQLFVGLHLVHEVTSPQAFATMIENGSTVAFPERTFATIDHIIPTKQTERPYSDKQAELMTTTLEKNVTQFKIPFFDLDSKKQGIVHVMGPELGLTQPGMTIVCGDSHTSTHGAFGSLAFGIGTSEVRDVLETQSLALMPLKVRKIIFDGVLPKGVYSKDVILKIIQKLGVKGGIGFAYEYTGTVFEKMTMEERMTVCNMSIEGGARIGYINPDVTTYDYLRGKEFAPKGQAFDHAIQYWESIQSDSDAAYDDEYRFDANEIEPMVTWGINPGQSMGISEILPLPSDMGDHLKTAEEAYQHMKLVPGTPIKGTPIQVGFIGSCTNSRISDLREAARVLKDRQVHKDVNLLVVPGSQQVKQQAEAEGLDIIFKESGAEWR